MISVTKLRAKVCTARRAQSRLVRASSSGAHAHSHTVQDKNGHIVENCGRERWWAVFAVLWVDMSVASVDSVDSENY